uniref:Uncharacterized protein n=1 Tax=Anguilla anguilla TaxID=7936 RepID=A0A0E9TXH0_ANGAN
MLKSCSSTIFPLKLIFTQSRIGLSAISFVSECISVTRFPHFQVVH